MDDVENTKQHYEDGTYEGEQLPVVSLIMREVPAMVCCSHSTTMQQSESMEVAVSCGGLSYNELI